MTPLDALIEALRAGTRFDPAVQARPEAVLWCDPERSFTPILPMLRTRMSELHTLGAWDETTRTAPAFQLRAEASQAEADGSPPPVLWLPGVGRETLRSAADCPPLLEPLVWLAASGAFFGHVNGKDWTLRGFLAAERGPVKLDIADGAEARDALALAAPKLMGQPLENLGGRRFDAEALHALVAPDLNDEVLDWMEGRLDPSTDGARFKGFAQRMARTLKFDPRKLTREDAVRSMAERRDRWAKVWERYGATFGQAYPGVTAMLAAEEPPGVFGQEETFPQANREAEDKLRRALLELTDIATPEARLRILSLERTNGHRRDTVWGRRGEAPLASALKDLCAVAVATPSPEIGAKEIGEWYFSSGAAVDGAAVSALATAPSADDRTAVTAALRAIYIPWLDEGARRLQALAAAGKAPFGSVPATPADVTAVVFVDGLRFDLALRLVARLKSETERVALGWDWTGFPTTTACCKPLVSPAGDLLTGEGGEALLCPLSPDGKPVNQPELLKLLESKGFSRDDDAPRRWVEIGNFDEDGHALGVRLVDQLERGIADAAACILALARAGRRVRVVTDHGWLLAPGGLEAAKLGVGLAEPDQKRTRYARLKDGAPTQHAQAVWSWNPKVHLAMAPGATSFYAGNEYAHGGVSPQECVIPVITVEPISVAEAVEITRVSWLGLRLRVETMGGTDLRLDLRPVENPRAESLAKNPSTIGEDGRASLLVSDEYEGREALAVILDDDDRIVARLAVKVGG